MTVAKEKTPTGMPTGNSIKVGYKQTELGVIPEDWDVCFLSEEIDKLEAGVSVNSVTEAVQVHDYAKLILKTSSVTNGKFLPFECKIIAPKDINRARLNPRADTIIFSRMNTPELVGECGYVDRDYNNLYIPDRLWMSVFKKQSQINVKWLSYLLSYKDFKKKIKESATGTSGSMKNISKSSLLSINFPRPNIKEQTAIATILSDTDTLIEGLEKLITKKKAIKQGAMQQLLTGKGRLPGFSGEWEMRKLGEIASVIGGGTPSTYIPNYWNGTINWFTPTEIGVQKYAYDSLRKISKEGLQNCSAKILSKGTILLTSRAGIGDLSILMNEGCTNQGFQSLVANTHMDHEFLYYLVSTLKNTLIQNASGSTFLEISPNKIKQIEIKIPNLKEQAAIATILSDMDTEIESLEKKRDKYMLIKQGMMQQLLTGKIRLLSN